jgi:hypothetical protein
MSDEQLPYSPGYIKAWSILSIVVALCLLIGFFLCNHLLHAGGEVWGVIRWVFSPII